jgi:putative flippase GtrA
MAWLEALALPIPRYRSIEILAEHTSEPAFRILVVIPTLGERLVTLPRTLASIRNQARALIDLVIVTNNLTPELSALAELYHARVIVHPGHISAAVNAGFAQASKHHKYAGWLGDDDMLRPDALDTASALLERHPAAVVSYGACDYVDINGELLFNRRPPFNAPTLLQLIPGLIKQEACLFRLSALRKVGGLDEQLKYTMDLDLLLKLHRLGPFVRANHVHAAFCWHPDSLTVANRRASLDEAQQVQGMHVRGLARLLKPLWQHPIRRLILAMSSRINQGLHQPTTPAFRSHDNSQFVKYVLVGLVNTAFSYGVYAALIYIGQAYWIANLWALILGIAFSFTTHGTLVFRNATRATFVRFLAAWTLIYMFNTAVIAALMRASMNAYLAGAIATIPGTLASYFILKLVVFAWKKPAQSV